MIPLRLDDIASAAGLPVPAAAHEVLVTDVEFDSRRVGPGTLFVALRGDRADGHEFAEAARDAGAVAVLGTRDVGVLPTLVCPGDDSTVLQALAAIAHRSVTALIERGLTVVGVTGSAGKTSTKDLIAAVLATDGPTIAPPESFNNELGHPYTVLRADDATRYLVLELSARGPGHIAALAATAPPLVGAVLNVGSAHLGEFGSVAAIAAAKGELVEALPAAVDGGVAVLNADDPAVAAMAGRTTAAVVRVGLGIDADVRALDVRIDDRTRAEFTLSTPEGSAPVRLRVAGEHQVGNALAAAAVGRAVGLGVDQVAAALSAAGPASKWRMDVADLPGGVTVVNDAYNANPESMRAALRSLTALGTGRRTWAVLGPMGELGEAGDPAHLDLGRQIAGLGIDRLVVVDGDTAESSRSARLLHQGAGLESSWAGEAALVADVAAAVALLRAALRPGDVVLVKASRAAGLERVALALIDEGSTG